MKYNLNLKDKLSVLEEVQYLVSGESEYKENHSEKCTDHIINIYQMCLNHFDTLVMHSYYSFLI